MVRTFSLLVLLAVSACAVPLTPLPPPPQGLKAVAVAKPKNSTGTDLYVNDVGLLGGLLDNAKTTSVPKLLDDDLRAVLGRADFRIVPADSGNAPILRTEIRRWQPFSADFSHVTVDIAASLVEPKGGTTLWSADRSNWAVPTSGAANEYDATIKASRKVAEDLVEGWQIPRAPQREEE